MANFGFSNQQGNVGAGWGPPAGSNRRQPMQGNSGGGMLAKAIMGMMGDAKQTNQLAKTADIAFKSGLPKDETALPEYLKKWGVRDVDEYNGLSTKERSTRLFAVNAQQAMAQQQQETKAAALKAMMEQQQHEQTMLQNSRAMEGEDALQNAVTFWQGRGPVRRDGPVDNAGLMQAMQNNPASMRTDFAQKFMQNSLESQQTPQVLDLPGGQQAIHMNGQFQVLNKDGSVKVFPASGPKPDIDPGPGRSWVIDGVKGVWTMEKDATPNVWTFAGGAGGGAPAAAGGSGGKAKTIRVRSPDGRVWDFTDQEKADVAVSRGGTIVR